MHRSGFILALVLACIPSYGYGAVLINEIAWMGTAAGANEEWIELYNNGTDPVDMTGWSLVTNGSLAVTFGTDVRNPNWDSILNPGDYALLERTDDTTVEGEAFFIYAGAMVDTGLILTLCRTATTGVCLGEYVEDQVAGGTDWQAVGGNKETKHTAQRTSSGWGTGIPTPGAANTQTATQQPTSTTSTSTTQSSSSSTKSRKASPVKKTKLETSEGPLELTLSAPAAAYVNQPVLFELTPTGSGRTIRNSLKYSWNFGDTYTATEKSPFHVFAYPGEYIVIVEAAFAKQKAHMRHEITILPMDLSLGRTESGDILVHNDAPYEVDISGYQLQGATYFVLPRNTLLKAGGTLTVSAQRIEARQGSPVALYDTDRNRLASTEDLDETALVAVPLVSETSSVSAGESDDSEVIHIGSSTPRREDAQPVSQRTQIPKGFFAIGAVAAAVLYLRRREVP